MKQLSQEEIKRRMQEWRNLKVLHRKAVEKNKRYEAELKAAKAEIVRLKKENTDLKIEVEDIKLQLEEMKKIVFGSKKDDDDKKGGGCSFMNNKNKAKKKKRKKRNKKSYHRQVPKEEEITERKTHKINKCPDCETKLTRKKIVIFYEEDIELATKDKQIKNSIENQVEKGWCKNCKKWHAAIKLPSKKVIIGPKVKLYICYLSILLRISYSQIINLLKDAYGFEISNGEIANILDKIGQKLRPEFERIKDRLQKKGKGVHLDETSWRKLYMWVMASIDTEDVVYLAGRHRGNGNVDDLIGKDFKKIRISDAYRAYKNKSGIAQQCWAHPHRKLRDLAKSKALTKAKQKHCQKTYQKFSKIYKQLRVFINEPYKQKQRREQKQNLLELIRIWSQPHKKDPKKLKNIKLQFVDYENEWFNCMDYEGVPCDNNKAERMLRHFVIKRKISFGTKTKRTSENFSVLASVFMTFWKKYKNDFFYQIAKLV